MIKLENVDKFYKIDKTKVQVLNGINLKVKKGEFVAVIGKSGSGKSTLMNLIGCLDIPTNGKVFLDEQDISKLSEDKLAKIRGKKIGFVFQNFNLYPTLTVRENIELPMQIHNFDEKRTKEKTKELLELVGLEHRASHLPSQLSGGEKQRVAIARALSTEPLIILADEPTGNLDTNTGKEIIELLKKLNKEKNVTIIVVTHDIGLKNYADRVIKIQDGVIN